jgi:hypothetical protein
MKDSITKFDLDAAFKALDEIETPTAEKGIKANKPALTEIFSRKSNFEALFEEYYDVSNSEELSDAKGAREAEVAKAKLARIEKIVDLDAESPDDLLTSYVGKFIIQCPQCMTLFYKAPEDVEESEDDEGTVNVNETCQHCGNKTGYTLVGKVGEATPEETEQYTDLEAEVEEPSDEAEAEEVDVDSYDDESSEEASEEDIDLNDDLEELDLNIEEDESEETNEALQTDNTESASLVEELTEDAELETSAEDFEKLIKSSEFQKPISDNEARAMIDELEDENEDIDESAKVDETESTPEEPSKEALNEGGLGTLGKALGKKIAQAGKNAKNKLATAIDKVQTREEKADWILANALEDFENIKINNSNKLVPDENNNSRFNTFVVVGFKERYSNGKLITMAPSFNNKDLVIGKNGVQEKKAYKDADNIAKGWSMAQGNGPAFIYLAKDRYDDKAVFLCEYFNGELENDQLEKYFKIVQKNVEATKLLNKSGMIQDEDEVAEEATANESLTTIMNNLEELQETVLEKLISDSLVEAYKNVASFRLIDCKYLNEEFSINGKILFESGAIRNTSYVFTEAFTNDENKITLIGLNEKLGLDKQFTLVGSTEKDTKTFIAESFKPNHK